MTGLLATFAQMGITSLSSGRNRLDYAFEQTYPLIKQEAEKLGLTGWVKNLADNRVEAVFAGSKENIERAIAICKKGPFLSEVKDVVVEWEDSVETFKTFDIVY